VGKGDSHVDAYAHEIAARFDPGKLFWRMSWACWGSVPEIPPSELHTGLSGWQLVDVRTGWEYGQGHIDGARSVPLFPLSTFEQRVRDAGVEADKPVALICLSAHRSIPAYRSLARAGFREPRQLKGGMRAWRAEKLPEATSA
jgi:rhodanese-related sulfurtransferase